MFTLNKYEAREESTSRICTFYCNLNCPKQNMLHAAGDTFVRVNQINCVKSSPQSYSVCLALAMTVAHGQKRAGGVHLFAWAPSSRQPCEICSQFVVLRVRTDDDDDDDDVKVSTTQSDSCFPAFFLSFAWVLG